MRKTINIVLGGILLAGMVALSLGCSKPAATTSAPRQAKVTRGNVSQTITASGNLDLYATENMAFEQAGTVDQVNVAVGDSVKTGQVIATLDTSGVDDQLASLNTAIINAQRNLLQMQINLEQVKLTLENDSATTTTNSAGKIVQVTTDPKKIEIDELNVELAQGKVDDATKAVTQAQQNLADAQNANFQVVAPIDGYITAVSVKGGQTIQKGTVAAVIADPDKFQATINVSEMDIPNVKLGGSATVAPQAFSTVSLTAKVTQIPPTATIQQGVVNYQVTVQLDPLPSSTASQGSTTQTPQTTTTAPATGTTGRFPSGTGTSRLTGTSALPSNFQLRDGMTVIVSVVVAQRTDVLLVPNGAISTKLGQSSVQLVGADGTATTQNVTTGLSDYQNTEVLTGLNEGDTVLVIQSTTGSSSTSGQRTTQAGPNVIQIPGAGGLIGR